MRRDELQEQIIREGRQPQVCPECNKPTLYPRQSKDRYKNHVCRQTGRFICAICGLDQQAKLDHQRKGPDAVTT